MNRIQQLADQAKTSIPHGTLGIEEWIKTYNQKFAELIVRECIDIVSPYAVRMENFDGGHPITDLKKHFGVEE